MRPDLVKLFDANAEKGYDKERRQLIPCFDEFYGTALDLLDSDNSAPKVLDLGTGTGMLAQMVLDKYPQAELTLIDLSEKMLAQAAQRFEGCSNVKIVAGDYTRYAPDEQYGFVVSSLSIHHLEHVEKQKLFRTIYDLLKPGGVFINADQVSGDNEYATAYYRRKWLEQIRASGLPEESIQASVKRRELDIDAPLQDQLAWLEQAGFTDVDCAYKNLAFAVMYGRKQA